MLGGAYSIGVHRELQYLIPPNKDSFHPNKAPSFFLTIDNYSREYIINSQTLVDFDLNLTMHRIGLSVM